MPARQNQRLAASDLKAKPATQRLRPFAKIVGDPNGFSVMCNCLRIGGSAERLLSRFGPPFNGMIRGDRTSTWVKWMGYDLWFRLREC